MKIKTITCHDVYNVGASLQAYALAEYLNELGHDVEIIDYKPDYLSNHYSLWGVNNTAYDKPVLREIYQILKFPGRLSARIGKRKKAFDRFKKEYLPISEKRYESNEELKKNPPEAEVYFAGSDQIWNTLFNNGKDPAFYLDFAPEGTVKASYAASFATEDILAEWKPHIRKWLSEMDYISVRESSGVKIINSLGINKVVQVLDPVFLLDREQWEQIEEQRESEEKYLFLYDFDRNSEMEIFVKKLAKEKRLKIYSFLHCEYCDRCFVEEGPQGFISLIHNAQFIVSNSFHATVFSLIFHKQFVVFNRTEKINVRMSDLLSLIGLDYLLISSKENDVKEDKIDYSKVDIRLEQLILESKKYIETVLKGAEMSDEKENTVCN